jgi:hypothetical protein
MKRMTKIMLAASCGFIIALYMTTPVMGAVTAQYSVAAGDSWTWRITSCIWDNASAPEWKGKGATITVSEIANTSAHLWVKGNTTLFDVDGSTLSSLPGVVLGNVSINDPSDIVLCFTNVSSLVLPVILPLPLASSLPSVAAILNDSIQELFTQYSSEIPFTVDPSFTVTVNETTRSCKVLFNVSGTVGGYPVTNQALELAVVYDENGVAESFTATALDVPLATYLIDVVIFKVSQSAAGPELPGFSPAIVALISAAAASIVALRIKRRK